MWVLVDYSLHECSGGPIDLGRSPELGGILWDPSLDHRSDSRLGNTGRLRDPVVAPPRFAMQDEDLSMAVFSLLGFRSRRGVLTFFRCDCTLQPLTEGEQPLPP